MSPTNTADTAIYVGSLGMTALGSLSIATLIGWAWVHRRDDIEYLLSALASICIAVYALGLAVSYGAGLWPPGNTQHAFNGAQIAIFGIVPVPALMTHAALRFSRAPYSRAVLAVAYGLTFIFLVCCSLNMMWAGAPKGFASKQALGLTIIFAPIVPTVWGKAFFATAASLTLVAIHEFGHALRKERHEVQPAIVGAIILAITQLNDIANALKWVSTIYLMAFGYATFAVGILLTVVSRDGARSRALVRRTEDLNASGEQVSRAYIDLELAQTELVRSKRFAAVGELAAVVAHEVRNPLAIVTNAVVSLRKSDSSVARSEALLSIIDEEIRRLDRLAAQLRDYGRPISVEAQTIDVAALLERCATVLAPSPSLTVTFEHDEPSAEVEGDPDLLRQAFENIIQNAANALDHEGHIKIHTSASATAVTTTISDDGPGMNPEVLARATAPFFSTYATGTGLGLAVVQRVVEAHDGQLRLEAVEGKGASVILTLPRELSSRSVSIAKTLGPGQPFASPTA